MTTADEHLFKDGQCNYDGSGDKPLLERVYICCPMQGDVLPNSTICGQSSGALRIVGGKEAVLNEFPWMAMLLYRNGAKWRHFCAGSLINNRYVLTAAHCVIHESLQRNGFVLQGVRLGEHNIRTNPDCQDTNGKRRCALPHLDIGVENSIVHNNYNVVDGKYYNDIALLRLQKPVRYTRAIQPICVLPGASLTTHYFSNYPLQIAGWGVTGGSDPNYILSQAKIKGRNSYECSRRYPILGINTTVQLCAGGQDGSDTCTGDSGSPLMASMERGDEEFVYLAGITSYGGSSPCGAAAIYTRTEKFIEWIQLQIQP
ncbi:spaetzle-processing enzyme-like [Drosophila takahashii]|uniref:spaetzle-processing enzyme-like n=1 Tax=Drosophila takahashii TaxID=29030 RepID=UPI003899583D